MTDRELMQQALEALEKVLTGLSILDDGPDASDVNHAQGLMVDGVVLMRELRPALRSRLAQPVQEPVKESSVTHSHLWIGDLYGKEKNA